MRFDACCLLIWVLQDNKLTFAVSGDLIFIKSCEQLGSCLAGPLPLHVPHPARDRRLLKLDCRKVLYHQAFQHYHHHRDHRLLQRHCHSMRSVRLSHCHPQQCEMVGSWRCSSCSNNCQRVPRSDRLLQRGWILEIQWSNLSWFSWSQTRCSLAWTVWWSQAGLTFPCFQMLVRQ